jgi:hypothetical protein
MGNKRGDSKRKKRNKSSQKKPRTKHERVLLEHGTIEGMVARERYSKDLAKYHWEHYSELAYQRNLVQADLLAELQKSVSHDLEIKNWRRLVKYKYSNHPLCTKGSIMGIGGRFNIGKMVNPSISTFPALYLANDKETAEFETLGQAPQDSNLSPHELVLTSPDSISTIAVNGSLGFFLDLRTETCLKRFVECIKDFSLPESLIKTARRLGQREPAVLTNASLLHATLLEDNWRFYPMQLDVPSNSQIFGHLVYLAKIEGILYPSKFTGKECFAMFPRNFAGTASFVEIADETPASAKLTRIDANTFSDCER